MLNTCTKRFPEIPFAHRAPLHAGHCRFIHGHNWVIEATFAADDKDKDGFIVDFGQLGFLKKYLARFDHSLVLAKSDPLTTDRVMIGLAGARVVKLVTVNDASSEGLAIHFYRQFNKLIAKRRALKKRGVRVVRLTVYEDTKNSATYEQTQSE